MQFHWFQVKLGGFFKNMSTRKKISRAIPLPIRVMLWGRAAGRCQFGTCNRSVTHHPDTKEDVNIGEAAHIIGFSSQGPRGEKDLSPELAKDLSNLMLLCGICHKTIDDNKETYPNDVLKKMKQLHEDRIELTTGIHPSNKSHVLLYGANIQSDTVRFSKDAVHRAMLVEQRFPAERNPIELSLVNCAQTDDEVGYWSTQDAQLRKTYATILAPQIANNSIESISVFALAPQPLLFLLGYLLSDKPGVSIYQYHRDASNWQWKETAPQIEYKVSVPKDKDGVPALVLALSASIADERIFTALGKEVSVWRIFLDEPNPHFIKTRTHLFEFSKVFQKTLDNIKLTHGESQTIHIFPAMPASLAIEAGRSIMKKADLPILVYDQNRLTNGFKKAINLETHSFSKGASA